MPGKLNQFSMTLAWMRMMKDGRKNRRNQLKIMVHACYCAYTTVQFDEEMCLTSFSSSLSPIHTGLEACVQCVFLFLYTIHIICL